MHEQCGRFFAVSILIFLLLLQSTYSMHLFRNNHHNYSESSDKFIV